MSRMPLHATIATRDNAASEARARITTIAPAAFVWAVWGAMFAAAIAYVARFGCDVPYWDEWDMVPIVTGAQPVTPGWLWESHNGHRVPLPKLVLLGLYKISGSDFRAGMYFDAIALGAIAALMMIAARRLRGRTSVADAFFPLLLLHWGHYENLLWTWQVTQVVPVIVLGALLLAAVRYGIDVPFRVAIVVALGVISLPLSGVPGLSYAPPMALWLVLIAARQWQRRDERSRTAKACVMLASALLTLGIGVLYFRHYPPPIEPLHFDIPRESFRTAMQFIAGGAGPAARALWDKRTRGTLLIAFTFAIFVGALAMLIRSALRERHTSRRSLVLLLFIAGGLALAASVGLGRPGRAFTPRYFILAAPIWIVVYFAWIVVRPPSDRLARLAPSAMLLGVLALTAINYRWGLDYGRDYHRRMSSFLADVKSGTAPARLVCTHISDINPCTFADIPTWGIQEHWDNWKPQTSTFPSVRMISYQDQVAAALRLLHRAGVRDYAQLNDDDPAMHGVPLSSLAFTASRAADRDALPPGMTDDQACWVLTLRQPIEIAGLRVPRPRAGHSRFDPNLPANVQVFWRLAGQKHFVVPQRGLCLWDHGQDHETFWIFAKVDQIAVHTGDLNLQRRIRPEEIELTVLLPAKER